MAGIPIISNFDVSSYAPIDSRMVVANAAARTSLSYLYEGLKVYQTDTKVTWVYKGTGWFVDGNGIYGGSGSLIGDTIVDTGSIGTTSGSQSYAFRLTTNTGSQNPYLSTTFKRNNNGSDWTGVEATTAYSYDTAGAGITALSWITYNAKDTISGPSTYGNIEYYINNSKTLTIAKNVLRLWNPTYSATIKLTSLNIDRTYNLPNQGGTFAMVSDIPTSISLPNVGTSGTYGSSNNLMLLHTDAQGRVTSVTNYPVSIPLDGMDTIGGGTYFLGSPSKFLTVVGSPTLDGSSISSIGFQIKIWNKGTPTVTNCTMINPNGTTISSLSTNSFYNFEVISISPRTLLKIN